MPNGLLGDGPGRREWVVTQEPDNPRKVPQPGLRGMRFPVVDRGFVHTELLRYMGLEEAQVEPALAEVVAYRNELSGIGLRWWLGRLPAQMAKRQRNGARAGI